ncbi:hypothetical protein ACLB1T_18415 [Escherichia coli]
MLTGHPQANLNREWQVVASDLHGEQPQAVPGRRGSGTTLDNHFGEYRQTEHGDHSRC